VAVKETALGLGVILLFAGVIVLPLSMQQTSTSDFPIIAHRSDLEYPDWTLSAHLNASDSIVIYFSRPALPDYLPEPSGERYMFVEVLDPQGGNTTFNVTFTKTSFLRGVVRNDGGLIIQNPEYLPTVDIGGKTQYTGLYTVRVYPIVETMVPYYYPDDGTMVNLDISKVVVTTQYPYIAALPVAVALAVVGVGLAVWGARSPKRRVRSRRS
jgi:hypothetical protein